MSNIIKSQKQNVILKITVKYKTNGLPPTDFCRSRSKDTLFVRPE